MKKEAAEAGFYKSSDGSTYARLQILTIQQILDGKQPLYPGPPPRRHLQESPAQPPRPRRKSHLAPPPGPE